MNEFLMLTISFPHAGWKRNQERVLNLFCYNLNESSIIYCRHRQPDFNRDTDSHSQAVRNLISARLRLRSENDDGTQSGHYFYALFERESRRNYVVYFNVRLEYDA